jgi:hypothetical protein
MDVAVNHFRTSALSVAASSARTSAVSGRGAEGSPRSVNSSVERYGPERTPFTDVQAAAGRSTPCETESAVAAPPAGGRGASRPGILTVYCTTPQFVVTVGIPSGLSPLPPGFGISSRRTGWGRYASVRSASSTAASHRSRPAASMSSNVIPSTPGAPPCCLLSA